MIIIQVILFLALEKTKGKNIELSDITAKNHTKVFNREKGEETKFAFVWRSWTWKIHSTL